MCSCVGGYFDKHTAVYITYVSSLHEPYIPNSILSIHAWRRCASLSVHESMNFSLPVVITHAWIRITSIWINFLWNLFVQLAAEPTIVYSNSCSTTYTQWSIRCRIKSMSPLYIWLTLTLLSLLKWSKFNQMLGFCTYPTLITVPVMLSLWPFDCKGCQK